MPRPLRLVCYALPLAALSLKSPTKSSREPTLAPKIWVDAPRVEASDEASTTGLPRKWVDAPRIEAERLQPVAKMLTTPPPEIMGPEDVWPFSPEAKKRRRKFQSESEQWERKVKTESASSPNVGNHGDPSHWWGFGYAPKDEDEEDQRQIQKEVGSWLANNNNMSLDKGLDLLVEGKPDGPAEGMEKHVVQDAPTQAPLDAEQAASLAAERGASTAQGRDVADGLQLLKKKGKPHKVAWFHAPKTGLGFGVSVMRYANDSLPDHEGGGMLGAWNPFFAKYDPGLWFKDGIWQPPCDHAPITNDVFESYRGNFVGLFRQPEQRIIASWLSKGEGQGELTSYAHRAEGSVTKQLAGQEDGEKWLYWPGKDYCGGVGAANDEERIKPDVNLALHRLNHFKFAGLVEEYDLSVCLFHAKFGGKCLPTEFKRIKLDTHKNKLNTDELKGFTDEADGQIYRAVKKMFWHDIEKYGVTRSKCKALCPISYGAFDINGANVSAARPNPIWFEYDWPGRGSLDEMWA